MFHLIPILNCVYHLRFLTNFLILHILGYRADVTYEGEARVTSYQQPQPSASSYKPVQVPAPRSYTPVSTEAPYQPSAPAPAPAQVITYRDAEPAASAPVDSFEPVAQASNVDTSNVSPGEVTLGFK